MKISERMEFATKAPPLTCSADTSVFAAVQQMADKNYGSVVVTDADGRVEGMMTERDIFRRLIAQSRDPKTTSVSEIMTRDVRTAKAEDELFDWLRIMSNERFRRLPVVDNDGRLISVMSQGDFVAYTWPQVLDQAGEMVKAKLAPAFNPLTVLAAILGYTLLLVGAIVLLT